MKNKFFVNLLLLIFFVNYSVFSQSDNRNITTEKDIPDILSLEDSILLSEAKKNINYQPNLNQKAPNFNLKDLEGKTIQLTDFYGKVVLLHFFFRECAPCIVQIPMLNKLSQLYKSKGVIFIAISAHDTYKELIKFEQKHPLKNFHIIPSEKFITVSNGISKEKFTNKEFLKRQYYNASYPANLIVNKYGNIVYCGRGFSFFDNEDEKLLIKMLDKSLNE